MTLFAMLAYAALAGTSFTSATLISAAAALPGTPPPFRYFAAWVGSLVAGAAFAVLTISSAVDIVRALNFANGGAP